MSVTSSPLRPCARRAIGGIPPLALILALVLALLATGGAGARELKDGAGRSIALPASVAHVFAAGPPAAVILYSLAPEKMLGWPQRPAPRALELLGPGADLPALGRLTGRGGEANLETVLRLKPDLILDVGSTDPTYASLAERVQGSTGIPFLLMDGRLSALAETYRRLGLVLGVPETAGRQADFIEQRLSAVRARVEKVPPEKRPKIYLARGAEGIESARAGSINVEALEYAGGRNVVGETLGAGGLVTLSPEQVLAFDPDIIVALDPAFYQRVWNDPVWGQMRAVKAHKVVLAPQLPFAWVDFPPAVNRVIGVIWLAKLFYPELFPENLATDAKDFYRLFYHHDLSDAELQSFLADARFKP